MEESLQSIYETLRDHDGNSSMLSDEQCYSLQYFCMKWLRYNMRNFPRFVKSPSEIGALFSDVFDQMLISLGRYNPEYRTFEVWLKAIMRNVCLKAMKREKISRKRFDFEPDKTLLEVPSQDEPIGHALEAEEDRIFFREAVDRLPEDLKNVVICRVYEEMSNEDTASYLELTKEQVSRLLYRAKHQLIKMLPTEKY